MAVADPMEVEVVCADSVVWSGRSHNIIAKTVAGEIGILPGHAPLLGVLQPSAVVIFDENGGREVIAVDGGFISVAQGRVSILSEYATMAGQMSVAEAERELAEAQRALDTGDATEEERQRFGRATAQLRALEKSQ